MVSFCSKVLHMSTEKTQEAKFILQMMSKKHLQLYVDEFVYRFNARNNELHEVFDNVIFDVVKTNRLPYKELIQ